MNDHEAQRIAAAMHEMRPDWPTASLLTLIRKHLIEKPRRDVAVALAWVACESNTATPARVVGAGPWWRAAGIEGGAANRPKPFDATVSCGVCSLEYDRCRTQWAADHDYERADAAAANKLAGDALAGILDELRDRLAKAKAQKDEPEAQALEVKPKPLTADEHQAAMAQEAEAGNYGKADWHATRAGMKAPTPELRARGGTDPTPEHQATRTPGSATAEPSSSQEDRDE